MKKIVLLSLLALSVHNIATAQEYEPIATTSDHKIDVKKLRFGAYFAPNISWMRPTASKSDDGVYSVESNGSKVGYTWGLMIDYFFADNYGIATGFQVNTTGGKINATHMPDTVLQPSTVYNANFEYSLQYLELPFQLKLRTDDLFRSRIRAFGQIGLTAGVNIGKKVTYTAIYTDENGKQQTAIGDKEKLKGSLTAAPFTMQLNIGGGIERPISEKLTAYIALFFNNGFAPDATNPNEYNLSYQGKFSDGKIRLNNFALRFGLYF